MFKCRHPFVEILFSDITKSGETPNLKPMRARVIAAGVLQGYRDGSVVAAIDRERMQDEEARTLH